MFTGIFSNFMNYFVKRQYEQLYALCYTSSLLSLLAKYAVELFTYYKKINLTCLDNNS